MICQWRQIFVLQDTDKSRYFVIIEVNKCFIIRSPSLFFNEYVPFCHFHARAIAKRRKVWFHLRMSRILFAAKHSWITADHVVGSRSMKRKNKLLRMIIIVMTIVIMIIMITNINMIIIMIIIIIIIIIISIIIKLQGIYIYFF